MLVMIGDGAETGEKIEEIPGEALQEEFEK